MNDMLDTDFLFFDPLATRLKRGNEPSNTTLPKFQGYLVALEGGGTRSQAVLIDKDGCILHTVQSADVNINFTTYEKAQQTVQTAVRDLLQATEVPGKDVSICVSALVGPRFGVETFGNLLPNTVYHYYNEIEVVFARAGIYEPNGVGVVAGTGATAGGVRRRDNQTLVCGGWGSLLGDEGSGYALGLLGLRAAARAYEGRTPAPTQIIDAVCRHYELEGSNFRFEMYDLAYQKPFSRNKIAQFAPDVVRLANQNDPVALQITQKVSHDLAALVIHAAHQLFEPEDTFDVVVAGGMTSAGERLLAPLQTDLAKKFPQSNFHIGVEEPAIALGNLARFNFLEQQEK